MNSNQKLPKIFAISGQIASGSSTFAFLLAKKLNYAFLDIGQEFRKMAKKTSSDVLKFQQNANNNADIDKKIETEITLNFIKKHKNVVITGKLTPWFLAKKNIKSFKIFLTAPLKTRASRICKREPKHTHKTAIHEILSRERQHRKRWRKTYNIDRKDLSIYNLRINTNNLLPDKIVQKTLEIFK